MQKTNPGLGEVNYFLGYGLVGSPNPVIPTTIPKKWVFTGEEDNGGAAYRIAPYYGYCCITLKNGVKVNAESESDEASSSLELLMVVDTRAEEAPQTWFFEEIK
ncbi:hypothetical protein H0H93_015871 [Arthromyces matolae]|nr:hypothetical protein H0H93_015871 [Arthromyces matolae]